MMFKYLFVAFVMAGVHAKHDQDQTLRLRQQRYAKAQKASKVICHKTGDSKCPYREISISIEATDAHKDHHGDIRMSCARMCMNLSNNIFDEATCQCVDPEAEAPPADTDGCMPASS